MSGYFDRQGNEVSQEEWGRGYSAPGGNRVALDSIDGHDISTVHLGIDHQYGNGPPLIFETMIFGGAFDQECWRYSTEAEALEGHAAAVKRVRERGC